MAVIANAHDGQAIFSADNSLFPENLASHMICCIGTLTCIGGLQQIIVGFNDLEVCSALRDLKYAALCETVIINYLLLTFNFLVDFTVFLDFPFLAKSAKLVNRSILADLLDSYSFSPINLHRHSVLFYLHRHLHYSSLPPDRKAFSASPQQL